MDCQGFADLWLEVAPDVSCRTVQGHVKRLEEVGIRVCMEDGDENV
jgi:hypothetical protein